MSPARRQLGAALRDALNQPVTRIVSGTVTAVDSTNRLVTMTLAGAAVKVWVPSSITLPTLDDTLYCIDAAGHYWPFAFQAH